jgi:hypothetical protein
MIYDINWFKSNYAPYFSQYVIEYRFFDKGDFGSLNQVVFNNEHKGGNIDFWENGSLGIQLIEYSTAKDLLNVLWFPEEFKEQQESLEKLKELI